MKLGKKQMMLLLTMACIVTQVSKAAFAKASTEALVQQSFNTYMVNVSRVNMNLSIDSTGNAIGTVYARMYNGDAAQAYIYLDRYINGRWTCIDISQQSGYPTITGSINAKVTKGYDYRLRMSIFVYTNGVITETLHDTSDTVSY